jgi:hypothetical protein
MTRAEVIGDLIGWVNAGGSLEDRKLEIVTILQSLDSDYRALRAQVERLSRDAYWAKIEDEDELETNTPVFHGDLLPAPDAGGGG